MKKLQTGIGFNFDTLMIHRKVKVGKRKPKSYHSCFLKVLSMLRRKLIPLIIIIKANIIYHDTRSQIWITLLIKVSLYHLILSFDIK